MAQNNNITMSGGVSKEKIRNDELVEAIKEMRANFSPETQNKVINLALRATFLLPAVLDKNQEIVADANNHVKFQDKQTIKFLMINKKQTNENFFPVFTDPEEFDKFKSEQKHNTVTMKFADIAGLTENTPQVSGFVINPFNQNLPFTKEMLESIKQTLIQYRQEREAKKAAAENPDS